MWRRIAWVKLSGSRDSNMHYASLCSQRLAQHWLCLVPHGLRSTPTPFVRRLHTGSADQRKPPGRHMEKQPFISGTLLGSPGPPGSCTAASSSSDGAMDSIVAKSSSHTIVENQFFQEVAWFIVKKKTYICPWLTITKWEFFSSLFANFSSLSVVNHNFVDFYYDDSKFI